MKFFMPVDHKHGKFWLCSTVYGPYEDEDAMKKDFHQIRKTNRNVRFLVFDGEIRSVDDPQSEEFYLTEVPAHAG